MTTTKYFVKVTRGGARAVEYVQRIDRKPFQTTLKRKLALIMGKFTAQDIADSLTNSHCTPELVAVQKGD